ncbi:MULTISPECIES: biotin--[acetyl-CoA-carboxylase] ligase [unclassified Undibacterium]|uniref:biotin--[acetyl-CoA-carboxylase] ligase n=1 Tax=unclassified Undibacterium TaxID=2630295 RepID=UPI002AC92600|nr:MULTISPECIES: biotin--[acetyl-CoA-carboxylase] ligase [unclassified Undibacterium]MEB0137428.1 biotin--[acetyl-CoA-carboxylase] ligase [Undibacterium sp. CCC2.1]MEB0170907.1 biotin--[acetyl-CoA-carboxylase] ligase [Undibacterium sp. CCC1.1]MEB0174859.1 biotin--[acetyl-CoA-carboxylase] ligase [Undibacterium sp. CCC3.4]MEB0214195.1 biotin--[acetyl-CoA-carboxylase] ligase [Undibacterium sp. 5I2]WPX44506.1 biotin--[acetyl-CoA-carboxylase] ligase [Undibacterium sp. CCC3.4]
MSEFPPPVPSAALGVAVNAAAIAALLPSEFRALQIEVVASTGSTNADLMARLPELETAVLRLALQQTAGRGRAGRSWLSEGGELLTFSLAWRMRQPVHGLLGLPLAIGVALAEALIELDVQVQLKWPNDVLRERKKLAGILIESTQAEGGGSWVVVGIGLNLIVPDELEARIGNAVADAPWLARMDRNALMAQLIRHLAASCEQFDLQGFAPFLPRWNRLHAYAQEAVQIIDHGRVLHLGIALGVDLAGCLVLQTDSGQVTVWAGDVSLRPV